jgi:hypothetical protein
MDEPKLSAGFMQKPPEQTLTFYSLIACQLLAVTYFVPEEDLPARVLRQMK